MLNWPGRGVSLSEDGGTRVPRGHRRLSVQLSRRFEARRGVAASAVPSEATIMRIVLAVAGDA